MDICPSEVMSIIRDLDLLVSLRERVFQKKFQKGSEKKRFGRGLEQKNVDGAGKDRYNTKRHSSRMICTVRS